MFKKTIAVLLLLSIVLSSCGKKDKDKSNDFVRTTPNQESTKSLHDALNACIGVHLSCPNSKLSEECSKAQKEDQQQQQRSDTDLWQACIDSEPCSEKREDFLKANVACLNSEIDYNKARKSCREARLACPDPEVDCPKAKLVCDKVSKEYPKTKLFCPGSEAECPEVEIPCNKSDTILAESEKVGYNNANKKACNEAKIVFYDSQVQCLESYKSCIESELNGTSSAE